MLKKLDVYKIVLYNVNKSQQKVLSGLTVTCKDRTYILVSVTASNI